MKETKEVEPIDKRIPKATFLVIIMPYIGKCDRCLQKGWSTKYFSCPRSTT